MTSKHQQRAYLERRLHKLYPGCAIIISPPEAVLAETGLVRALGLAWANAAFNTSARAGGCSCQVLLTNYP